MCCTDIIDKYYKDIAKNYIKYIGRSIDEVINDLQKTHIVKQYKISTLQNNDIVIWQSNKDKLAHVTVYKDYKFYYMSSGGVKVHKVLLKYINMLKPKYIVRLESK